MLKIESEKEKWNSFVLFSKMHKPWNYPMVGNEQSDAQHRGCTA